MGNLEERVTVLEGDMAQMRQEWRTVAQAPLINGRLLASLRETQLEHGRDIASLRETQLEQGRDISELRNEQARQRVMLTEHSVVLGEHSTVLAQHSVVLETHSADLLELKQGQQAIVRMLTTLIDRE